MLTNPVYAGAYAFGRRTARVTIENGRKRVVRSMQRDWRSWEVLIRDDEDAARIVRVVRGGPGDRRDPYAQCRNTHSGGSSSDVGLCSRSI
jgi:hypothetical protein